MIRECKGFFETLPLEEKERIEMKNAGSFLGWSRVSFKFFLVAFIELLILLDGCVVEGM